MNEWTVGQCANCDSALDPWAPPALFCTEGCKNYAKDVRFFRPRFRDGRALDPQVRETLDIRMQMLLWGGYSSKKRRVDPNTRSAVLAVNGGLCSICNQQPSTDVDHISGPSGERENLQGLCAACHNRKTRRSFQSPMEGEEEIEDAEVKSGTGGSTGLEDSSHGIYSYEFPMEPEDQVIHDAFLVRVERETPLRASDDDLTWEKQWRPRLADTKELFERLRGEVQSGSFGDGSTGTADDYEHGIYMQMLADRDD